MRRYTMSKTQRAIDQAETEKIIPLNRPAPASWALEPDALRDQVQRALPAVCVADGKRFCQTLLKGLEETGVHVGSSLFLLGIPATSAEDMTPSDMGKLLRYIRMNSPSAIEALIGPLAELFVLEKGP